MGFWKLSPDEEERKRLKEIARQAELERQQIDLAQLEAGGIPTLAHKRLLELGKTSSDADYLFTSDLAPDEMALLRKKGYKARGLVMGSAMYHVGQLFVSANADCEIKNLSDAYNECSKLAVERMRKELHLIGAHGVLGVRMEIVRHEWAEKTIEVQIIGTAVEAKTAPHPAKAWLSDLSAQEWFALTRAGFEPVGLVWGHCAWWLFTTYLDDNNERSWSNIEMTHWSEGLSNARHLALKKVKSQTKALGGSGVVGVNIQRRMDRMRLVGGTNAAANERLHHNILLSIVGTAVKASGREPHSVQQTTTVLSLRDGRLKPLVIKQGKDFKVTD
jgi:uncharacterized protein YbjQ (UPF0145 family)